MASELHGKNIFPIFKLIDDIKPGSFSEQMTDENYEKASGVEMKFRQCKADMCFLQLVPAI